MPEKKKRVAEGPDLRPLHLLEDEPVRHFGDDGLGLLDFAKVIAGAAVGTTGPFTIGVFAGWGQGKTSVLRQARSLIDEDPAHTDVVTVWFNAWQFEKEEHPIVPLVGTILRAIEARKSGFSARAKTWFSGAVKALRAVPYGISIKGEVGIPGLAKTTVGVDGSKMIDREEKLTEKERGAWERGLYFQAFEALEKLSYPEDKKPKGTKGPPARPKVVVFIDDLDRCLPDQGLKLLESLKLVLAQRGFIFVLAVDRRTIEGYLTKRYRDDFGVADYETSGTSYLDKIVQLPLSLPSHGGRFEDYIEYLLKKPTLHQNRVVRKALKGLRDVLAAGSAYNPRSLVRLINNLIVDQSIWVQKRKGSRPDLLGLCAVSRILSDRLGGLYQSLVNDNDLCEQIARGGTEAMLTQLESRKGEPPGLREERRKKVLNRLARAGLEAVIQTPAGQSWLTRHEERIEFDQFLVSEGEELGPEAVQEIVESEIRAHLGRAPGDPISEEDRANVRRLFLNNRSITDEGLAAIRSLENLRMLNLAENQITDSGVRTLVSLPALNELYLGGNAITDEGVRALQEVPSLEILGLASTQISARGIEMLAGFPNLSWLDLGGNNIQDAHIRPLQKLRGLQSLFLQGNQISDKGIQLLQKLKRLEALGLADSRIGRIGVERVAQISSLSWLDLGGNALRDADIDSLRQLEELRNLYLNDNRITDNGVKSLAGLSRLEALSLAGNRITRQGVGHLRALSRISWLDLGANELGDKDIQPLHKLSRLRSLYLQKNDISGEGLQALNELPFLEMLDLNENPIGNSGLKHLKPPRNLRHLYLMNTNVTQAGWNKLKESIPNLQGSYGRRAASKPA